MSIRMTDKKNPFVGTWIATSVHSDDYCIEYSIESDHDGLKVYAKDFQDNEELEISEVTQKGDTISFKSLIPSTQRKGYNQFRIKSNKKIEAKFTFTEFEELKKIPSSPDSGDSAMAIEGIWVAVAPYDENELIRKYEIKKAEGRFKVNATYLIDGEKIEISDVKYTDNTLLFMSYMPSTGRSGLNQFRLNPIGNVDSEFTFTVVEELERR